MAAYLKTICSFVQEEQPVSSSGMTITHYCLEFAVLYLVTVGITLGLLDL